MNKTKILIAVFAAALSQVSPAMAQTAAFDFDGRGGAALSLRAMAASAAEELPEPVMERAAPALRGDLIAPATTALDLGAFTYNEASKEFTLRFKTERSANYWGSRVEIKVELVQDKLIDSSLGVMNYEFQINWNAADPVITFKEADFAASRDAADQRAKARKFYVKWGYTMIKSELYSKDFIDKGRTGTLQIAQ